MLFSFNNKGYLHNSVSLISLIAFFAIIFSITAVNFLYDTSTSNKPKNNITLNRESYIKELEAFPVEPGSGTASFLLSTTDTKYVFNNTITANLKLINSAVTSGNYPNSFVTALFVPDSLEIIDPPQKSLIENVLINYVEYLKVTGGTQVNISIMANINAPISTSAETTIISLKVKLKTEGVNIISFVNKVPRFPEIVDITQKSMLDVSTLKDLTMVVEKPIATVPAVSPDSGVFNNAVKVNIINTLPESQVKYTVDNSDPRTSTSAVTVTTFPKEVILTDNSLKVFKAYTFGANYNPSDVVTKTYTYKVADITSGSNPTPNITNPFAETLNTITTGAKIYYTLDGTDPQDISKALLYDNVAINLNHTVTLKAVAMKNGYANSEIFTRTYNFSAPGVSYKGFGYCTNEIECEYGIEDINKTTLTLRFDATDPLNIPTKIGYYIYDVTGEVKKVIENVTPIGEIFTVNIENYLSYFKYNEPNIIKIRTYSSNGIYLEQSYSPKLNFLPVIESYSPQLLSTYNPKITFTVTASDGHDLIENSGISFIELFKKDIDGNYYSIKKVKVTQPGTRVIDFVVEDTLTKAGNYNYFILVYDNLLLTRTSNDIKISYYQKGDVNKDFKLDIANDLLPMVKAVFEASLVNLESMDIDGNNKLDVVDLMKFLINYFS